MIEGVTANDAVLQWVVPPANGAPITGYRVTAQKGALANFITLAENTESTEPSVVLDILQPMTAYRFRVAAINAVGVGETSPSSDMTTTAPGGLSFVFFVF